jgi:hypothetical protein
VVLLEKNNCSLYKQTNIRRYYRPVTNDLAGVPMYKKEHNQKITREGRRR